ncbi:MarR family winged helix-turn-helix transcriptional regulator [Micromonospora zhanjiangensis]|uniref:MarR family winged helix-turn-helix transcriptional regulator n=1 Tax=Micromonospora zhanjiangensis TaxID=1522057 RepID=A0ABV8KM44_9ACTN
MTDIHGSDGPDVSITAAVDTAAAALVSLWDAAREQAVSQLSASQLRALIVVERYDGINLRGLAKSVNMLLSSASRLCDRLVAAGVLEREPGRQDRREISLHLTPAGRKLLDELRDHRRQRLAEVLTSMSPAGRQALLRGLAEFDEVQQPTTERHRPARSA